MRIIFKQRDAQQELPVTAAASTSVEATAATEPAHVDATAGEASDVGTAT